MTELEPSNRILGRSMRFWGFVLIGAGGALSSTAILDFSDGFTTLETTVEGVMVVGGLLLGLAGAWVFFRHLHDPSSIEIWLNEIRQDERIQAELQRIDEQWSRGDLNVLGYETARNRLRFGKDVGSP